MTRKDTRQRIGIIGSQNYENKIKIKELIYKIKEQFNDNIIVASGGRTNGADKYIRKYVLELGIDYKEFNPAHTPCNLYSALNENYYGKTYSPVNFFHRNSCMMKYCDYLFIFMNENEKDNKDIEHAISEAKRNKLRFVIVT